MSEALLARVIPTADKNGVHDTSDVPNYLYFKAMILCAPADSEGRRLLARQQRLDRGALVLRLPTHQRHLNRQAGFHQRAICLDTSLKHC